MSNKQKLLHFFTTHSTIRTALEVNTTMQCDKYFGS